MTHAGVSVACSCASTSRLSVRFDADRAPRHRVHGGARRLHSRKELAVGFVISVELVDIGKVAATLHHVLEARARSGEHFADLLQSAARLLLYCAGDGFAGLQ